MYNSEDLEVFVMLARTLSFSQTARNLHLSQSTVSKRLQDLEQTLQVTLIERGQGMKTMNLTIAGENFLSIANELMNLWGQALHLGRRQRLSSFTIASLSSLNLKAIPVITDFLHERLPFMHLHIMTSHSAQIYDLIESHQADLGFSLSVREYPNIEVRKWYTEPMVVVRPAGTKMTSEVISPRDLPQELEIFNYGGIRFQAWHDEWWTSVRNSCISLDNASLVPRLLKKPGQWSVMQISLARDLAATGKYVIQYLTDPPPGREYYLLTHAHPTRYATYVLEQLDPYLKRLAAQWEAAAMK